MEETPQGRSDRLSDGDAGDLESQSEDQLRQTARELDIDERGLGDRGALLAAIRRHREKSEG